MAKTDLTPKQEKFVQTYLRLGNQRQAYRKAYSTKNLSDNAVDREACLLSQHPKITQRLQTLRERGAEKTVRSIESIDDMLQQSFEAAQGDEDRDPNPSAMTNAALAIAKLHGLITEKTKNTNTHDVGEELADLLREINQPVFPGAANGADPEQIDSYAHWMSDSEQALLYSESQHSGSLGPGRTLARSVDLSQARRLLDIGGGTGAMTISLCKAYPELHSTFIDFPNVAEIGWKFVSDADLVNRVSYVPGNALECSWPTEQHAILTSYLLSGVPRQNIAELLGWALQSLESGGLIMIHDFMVESDRRGPPLAALWQMQHMAFTPDAQSLSIAWLRQALMESGFEVTQSEDLIPGMTKLIVARKPG